MLAVSGSRVKNYVADKDQAISMGRWVLYVACFFIPLTAIRSFSGLGVSDFALLAAAFFALISMVPEKRSVPPTLVWTAVIALTGCVAVATMVGDFGVQAGIGLRMAFNWILWPLVALRLLRTREHLGGAVFAFVAGCSLSALVAVGQFAGIDVRGAFLATDVQDLTARYMGLNGQPNGQAGMLAVAFTIAVAAIGYGVKLRFKWMLALLCMAGIMLSASITGLIAATLGIVFVLLRLGKVRTLFGAAFAIGAGIGLYSMVTAAIPGLVTPLDRISSATGQTGISTLDLRLLTIDYAIDAIKSNPLSGVGFGHGAEGTYDGRTAVHNMEVLAWYQGGPFMLLAIVLAVAFFLRVGWKRSDFPHQELLFSAFVVALFFAQTGPTLFDRFLWVPAALMIVARQLRAEAGSEDLVSTGPDLVLTPPSSQRLSASASRLRRA